MSPDDDTLGGHSDDSLVEGGVQDLGEAVGTAGQEDEADDRVLRRAGRPGAGQQCLEVTLR